MMWTIGMADRDNSNDSRTGPGTIGNINAQTDDEEEFTGSTEGVGPSNEAAEDAIRALGRNDEEQNVENAPPENQEEEESKEDLFLVVIRLHRKSCTSPKVLLTRSPKSFDA